ncbi:MAG: hypothetical protein ACK5HL_01300 [Bacilli bacterium]
MCNNNSNECTNSCASGITDTLKTIVALQNAANRLSSEPETCNRNFLGNSNRGNCEFNTRPITLYGCGTNELMRFPVDKDDAEGNESPVLRCEKVDGCTIVCRVLCEKQNETRCKKYEATESFVTINMCCVGAVRCLTDTYVEICN